MNGDVLLLPIFSCTLTSLHRKGVSSPRLTMATVIDGLPLNYRKAVWQNRMQYAARHGYRYGQIVRPYSLPLSDHTHLGPQCPQCISSHCVTICTTCAVGGTLPSVVHTVHTILHTKLGRQVL